MPICCRQRTRRSPRWALKRSSSAPAASCWPPARRSASARWRRGTSSPRRRRRSRAWRAMGARIPRSARSCSSAPHRRVAPAPCLLQIWHQLVPGAPRRVPGRRAGSRARLTRPRGHQPRVPGPVFPRGRRARKDGTVVACPRRHPQGARHAHRRTSLAPVPRPSHRPARRTSGRTTPSQPPKGPPCMRSR